VSNISDVIITQQMKHPNYEMVNIVSQYIIYIV